jgi:hypothetical protein
MQKTMISSRLNDSAEGDVHFGNLSVYAKHLASTEDPDRAGNRAELLHLEAINALQQSSISNLPWSSDLTLEIGSRDDEVDALGFYVRKYS